MNDKINAAINFFPEFETLYSIIANEIVDLTDEQLDYTSDNWEWAGSVSYTHLPLPTSDLV